MVTLIGSLYIALAIILAAAAIFGIYKLIKYLTGKNRMLQEQLKLEEEKILKFPKEIKQLKEIKKPTEKDLEVLNNLARDFFKEKYDLKKSLTYTELLIRFKQNQKTEEAKFCNLMRDILYSDKKKTQKEIKKLINLMQKIIKESN